MNFEYYMQLALAQAQQGGRLGEVPIGAIVVTPQGQVIGSAFNQVERQCTQLAHAEMQAMQQAGQVLKDWRLTDCVLFSTLEPFAMCMSAMILSRLSRLVFAASSPLFGYRIDKQINFTLYSSPIEVYEGVLAAEASALLRAFFENRRRNGSE